MVVIDTVQAANIAISIKVIIEGELIRERSDLHFLFLTKRIERFMDCIPPDWKDGYENVTVGCTIENQENTDYRLGIFPGLPIKHKNIICQPLIENINLSEYLHDIELVVVGGESDKNARPLDYDWVMQIRQQYLSHSVHFEFRQCGTHFIKDEKNIRYPPVTYSFRREKQILIIE